MAQDDGKKVINLRVAIDQAPELPPPEPVKAAAPATAGTTAQTKAPAAEDGGSVGEPPRWSVEGLPPDCPVTPLGEDGRTCYYLDAGMHLWELPASEHNRLHIMRMFGQQTDFLYQHWPRLTPDKDNAKKPDSEKKFHTTGWRPEAVAESLSAACSRLGDWDAAKKVRGAGAWKDDDGRLVLHCGDVILTGDSQHKPGFIGGYVYPARAALPRPWPHAVPGGDDGPGAWLRSLLRTWTWKRGDLDVTLLIGAIGCGYLGGALKWRTMPWLTGGSGTGKSTLKQAIEDLYAGRLIGCEDPSSAGIHQKLGHATLPVAIDEHEPDELDQGRRTQAVVKLARMAASGALLLRGGADHHGTEFVVRSVFMFFSILIPALLPQDRNRIAVLSLGKLKGDAPAPEIPA